MTARQVLVSTFQLPKAMDAKLQTIAGIYHSAVPGNYHRVREIGFAVHLEVVFGSLASDSSDLIQNGFVNRISAPN
jgi:hypothetical protein